MPADSVALLMFDIELGLIYGVWAAQSKVGGCGWARLCAQWPLHCGPAAEARKLKAGLRYQVL